MKLLIDIGNTRIKWAMLEGSIIDTPGAHEFRQSDDLEIILDSTWHDIPVPEAVYVSSVAGEKVEQLLENFMKKKWLISPEFATIENNSHGLINGYLVPAQLGVDRWLAMLAAWTRCKSHFCIIDCGTALTIDVVDQDGKHLGGYIIPGMAMMQTLLNENTSQIDSGKENTCTLKPGKSTAECINNGALVATVALVNNVTESFKYQLGINMTCFLTGGGGLFIKDYLQEEFEFIPGLVLEGLAVSKGLL